MRLKDKLLKVIDTEQASRSDDVAKAIQSLQDVTDDNVLGVDMSASADTLSQLTVPADGRMRQTMVFNVHLRNP